MDQRITKSKEYQRHSLSPNFGLQPVVHYDLKLDKDSTVLKRFRNRFLEIILGRTKNCSIFEEEYEITFVKKFNAFLFVRLILPVIRFLSIDIVLVKNIFKHVETMGSFNCSIFKNEGMFKLDLSAFLTNICLPIGFFFGNIIMYQFETYLFQSGRDQLIISFVRWIFLQCTIIWFCIGLFLYLKGLNFKNAFKKEESKNNYGLIFLKFRCFLNCLTIGNITKFLIKPFEIKYKEYLRKKNKCSIFPDESDDDDWTENNVDPSYSDTDEEEFVQLSKKLKKIRSINCQNSIKNYEINPREEIHKAPQILPSFPTTYPKNSSSQEIHLICLQLQNLINTLLISKNFSYLSIKSILFSMKSFNEHKVKKIALLSRFIVFLIQFLARRILPAHENDGFQKRLEENPGFFDSVIYFFFGGFTNWDGQYFLEIAANGYSHENTIAFFPLFPVTVGTIAKWLAVVLNVLFSVESISILVGYTINVWVFQKSAIQLFKLTKYQLENSQQFDYVIPSVIYLFCFNPASIFFSAFYTETVFAYLTLTCIVSLYERKISKAVIFASLSSICRSNGLLNLGIVGLASFSQQIESYHKNRRNGVLSSVKKYSFNVICSGIECTLGLIPFILFQVFCKQKFCNESQFDEMNPFCVSHVLPYSYIQKSNWNVGLFQYFEIKQVPNFVLAAPVLMCLGKEAKRHFCLFLRDFKRIPNTYENYLEFIFSIHGLFLTLFCFIFIHVQVSTRFIMSACPYIYIYIVRRLNYEKCQILTRTAQFASYNMFIQVWFKFYYVIGTILFSLGYPWT